MRRGAPSGRRSGGRATRAPSVERPASRRWPSRPRRRHRRSRVPAADGSQCVEAHGPGRRPAASGRHGRTTRWDPRTPPRDEPLENHYMQLLAAASADPIALSYHAGRKRLDDALGRVLRRTGCRLPPELVIAVVDGAAVTAISEKRDVRQTAHELLALLIGDHWEPPDA